MKTPGHKVRVLIVEDSSVSRQHLAHILASDSGIEVAGFAPDGVAALTAVESLHPDVVTMDIHMPRLDGFSATRQIMEQNPVPIVIVTSSSDATNVRQSFSVIEAGAVSIMEKPPGVSHPDYATQASLLIQTVKLMSEVKVVRRWPRARSPARLPDLLPATPLHFPSGRCEVIAIAASTGGPPVLQALLHGLGPDLTVPVLIVQHIAAGFIGGFVDWMARSTHLPIQLAQHGLALLPGHVYVAPDDSHLIVTQRGRAALSRDQPVAGLRPSASALFRSMAEVYGPDAIGVILTGMGRDGADELKLMRDQHAVTFAQDAESSVVFGMPGEAIRIGAATYTLPPERIATSIISLLRSQGSTRPAQAASAPPSSAL